MILRGSPVCFGVATNNIFCDSVNNETSVIIFRGICAADLFGGCKGVCKHERVRQRHVEICAHKLCGQYGSLCGLDDEIPA